LTPFSKPAPTQPPLKNARLYVGIAPAQIRLEERTRSRDGFGYSRISEKVPAGLRITDRSGPNPASEVRRFHNLADAIPARIAGSSSPLVHRFDSS
jgi:hypothetical protein